MGEQLSDQNANAIVLARTRETLRLWGLGERTLKTALAASIAWELGTLVPGGTAHPYFAPLAALLSMQITVAESIAGAAQRVAGIVAGVGVAMVVTRVTGASALGIGLLVLLSLVVGTRLRLGPQAVSQVAISALLVMFVGNASSFSYAGSRIVESVVGALVGVAVNALLIPPSTLPQALTAQHDLGDAVVAALRDLAHAVAAGLTREAAARCLAQARALSGPRAAAAAELDRARTSLRYNMLRRGQLAVLTRLAADHETLEHAVIQTRSLARALADALADDTGGDMRVHGEGGKNARAWPALASLDTALAALIGALATAVERFVDATAEPPPDLASALAEVARRRRAVDLAVHAEMPKLTPDAWMRVGALLASADRMWTDLSRAVHSSVPRENDIDVSDPAE
jgi:uncharacterized membrane protein YgaE (UPF0421/DUF939 family)